MAKLFLDFSLLGTGTWGCNGCLGSEVCLFFSILVIVCRLMFGGAIPASLYKVLVGVGCSVPVMTLHASLSIGSIFLACEDLSHTGAQYSAGA